jgi:hypothetical protein
MVLPLAADRIRHGVREVAVRLCGGDDWAQDHHDIEVMDGAGRVLARRRLPEGVAGIGQLHELTGRFLPAAGDAEVQVGIETDRGPWVAALIAAGYAVFPVNPLQASRYRGRHGVSGAKSDGGDAPMLAGVVRTDAHQLRQAAGGSAAAEAVKVLARTHKTLIWERSAVVLRLRAQLREYFPAAVAASGDLDAPEVLELLGRAPDPASAAGLTRARVSAALKRAGRRKITQRADAILAALRSPQRGQPPALTAAYAATVRSLTAVIATLNEQVASLQGQVEAHLAGTRTLRSTGPSPGSARSPAPGCSPSSATTRTGTPRPRTARTTPAPARSPAPPARRRSSRPGSCATTGSSTP